MICIPTVVDRLVQRVIVSHLVSKKKLPIYNSSSYGFIKGRGTNAAIDVAKTFRSQHDWCLKTDIETFFDSIPRPLLKKRVTETLGRSSVVPLILKFIDCDIALDKKTKAKIHEHGIRMGCGLRQGMPLSPILANLILSNFDKAIERANFPMVRYADDLLIFFDSKQEAEAGHQRIKEILAKVDLKIPEIGDNSKTKIFGPKEAVDFLGREIVFERGSNSYVACVGAKQTSKIRIKLRSEYEYARQSKQGHTFQEVIVDLWRSVSAYQAIYSDAHDFKKLDQTLREIARSIISKIFEDIFGHGALGSLDNYKRNFLGIGHLNVFEAANDLDPN